jgi:hypothetical protein
MDHIKGLLLNDSKTSGVEKKNAFLEKEIKGIGRKKLLRQILLTLLNILRVGSRELQN